MHLHEEVKFRARVSNVSAVAADELKFSTSDAATEGFDPSVKKVVVTTMLTCNFLGVETTVSVLVTKMIRVCEEDISGPFNDCRSKILITMDNQELVLVA